MFPYDPLWSCMVFEILNSPIALLCPVRYEILADIESFAFLFRLSSVLRLSLFLRIFVILEFQGPFLAPAGGLLSSLTNILTLLEIFF